MTTRSAGGRPCAARKLATSSATAVADLVGDRPALEQPGATGFGHRHSFRGRDRLAAARRGRRPRGSRRRAARPRASSSSTRTVISPSNAGSPTDGRLTRTFAAAPWRPPPPSSDATSRSLDALALLRPASASAAPTTLEARLDAGERDLGGVPRRALHRRGPGGLLLVGLARQLHRGGERRRRPRRRRRPASGAGRRGPGRWPRPGRRSACSAYFGRPSDREATIATSPAPRLAATAEALPPPGPARRTRAARRTRRGSGHGSDRSGWTAPSDCRFAAGAKRRIRPSDGCAVGAPRPPIGRRSGTGRARYRRTRPASDRIASRRGRESAAPAGSVPVQAASARCSRRGR